VAGDSARRELAVAEQVLAERRELALTAARIAPPPYITKELGERPTDPTKHRAWERGVAGIESFRQEHGVKDPHRALGRERAFGPEPRRAAERTAHEAQLRRIRETKRVLGLGQHAARARDLGRGIGIGGKRWSPGKRDSQFSGPLAAD